MESTSAGFMKASLEKIQQESNLHRDLRQANVEACRILEDYKNLTLRYGNTLLHWAVFHSRTEIVSDLLQKQHPAGESSSLPAQPSSSGRGPTVAPCYEPISPAFTENDDMLTALDVAYLECLHPEGNIRLALLNHIKTVSKDLTEFSPTPRPPVQARNRTTKEVKQLEHFFDVQNEERRQGEGSGTWTRDWEPPEKKKTEKVTFSLNKDNNSFSRNGEDCSYLWDFILDEISRTKTKTKYCLERLTKPLIKTDRLECGDALTLLYFLETIVADDVYVSDLSKLSKLERNELIFFKKQFVRRVFGLKDEDMRAAKSLRSFFFHARTDSDCIPLYMQPQDFIQVIKTESAQDAFDAIKRTLENGLKNLKDYTNSEQNTSHSLILFKEYDQHRKPMYGRKEVFKEFVRAYMQLRGSTSESADNTVRFHMLVNVENLLDHERTSKTYRTRNKLAHDFTEPLSRDYSEVVFECYKIELAREVDDCFNRCNSVTLKEDMHERLKTVNEYIDSHITLTVREVSKYFPWKQIKHDISWNEASQQEELRRFIKDYLNNLALLSDLQGKEDLLQGLTPERKLQILKDLKEDQEILRNPNLLKKTIPDHNPRVNLTEIVSRIHDYGQNLQSSDLILQSIFDTIVSVLSTGDIAFLPLLLSVDGLTQIYVCLEKKGAVSEADIANALSPRENFTFNQRERIAARFNSLQDFSQEALVQGSNPQSEKAEILIPRTVRNILCMFDQKTEKCKLEFDDMKEAFRDRQFVDELTKIAEQTYFKSIETKASNYLKENKEKKTSKSDRRMAEGKNNLKTSWALVESWTCRRIRLLGTIPFAAPYVAGLTNRFTLCQGIVQQALGEEMSQPDLENDLYDTLQTLVCDRAYSAFLPLIMECSQFGVIDKLATLLLDDHHASTDIIQDILKELPKPQNRKSVWFFFKRLETSDESDYGTVLKVLDVANHVILDFINSASLQEANQLVNVCKRLHEAKKRQATSTEAKKRQATSTEAKKRQATSTEAKKRQATSTNVKDDTAWVQRTLHEGKLRLHEGMQHDKKSQYRYAKTSYESCVKVLKSVGEQMMALSMTAYAYCRLGEFQKAEKTQTKLWTELIRFINAQATCSAFIFIAETSESSALYQNLLRESTEHQRFLNLPTVKSNLIFYKFCASRQKYTSGLEPTGSDNFSGCLQDCSKSYSEIYRYLQTQLRTCAKNGSRRFVERQALRLLARRFVIHGELARLDWGKELGWKEYHYHKALELLIMLYNRRKRFFGNRTAKVKCTLLMIETATCSCFLERKHCQLCYKRLNTYRRKLYRFYYTISPFDGSNGSCYMCAPKSRYCSHLNSHCKEEASARLTEASFIVTVCRALRSAWSAIWSGVGRWL